VASTNSNHASLRNSVVLITGGTGSFGHTMARHLLERGCEEIRIFSRDEAKQDAMRQEFRSERLRFYLGDVRDRRSVETAMRGVHYVFHAAALKQVPSCEFFPIEAVRTNVLGSANVLEVAAAKSVRTVVCLSTDKAVAPLNAMGMSKALMEKVVFASARGAINSGTIACTVRYGNVLFSRGSVVPLFMRQATAGEPLTLTDPRMTRFMMNLTEAVALVEYAFMNASHGDLFIRKAPGALMTDVASAICTLLGSTSEIRLIGIRHGEKLHETLASASELRHAEDRGDYLRIPLDDRDLDYAKYFIEGEQDPDIAADLTSENARRMSLSEIEQLLLSVPAIGEGAAFQRASVGGR
jgi:UDP-N-acetylglucosamine 4,6-dehydratase/5-epimerase